MRNRLVLPHPTPPRTTATFTVSTVLPRQGEVARRRRDGGGGPEWPPYQTRRSPPLLTKCWQNPSISPI
ncbi:MAG: hypothetical protein EKK50_06580 [Sphingomonadaceae bacterium]|nr:MAG: hypothetical protein EKK50_06580 [Sphingomonadaceae bacterium]